MLETSQDLLNLAIAISVVGFTVFICWAIFYLIMSLRQVFKIIKETRQRLGKLDEALKSLKEKIEHSTSYLLLIGEGVKKLVDVIKERSEKKEDNKNKKKKKTPKA